MTAIARCTCDYTRESIAIGHQPHCPLAYGADHIGRTTNQNPEQKAPASDTTSHPPKVTLNTDDLWVLRSIRSKPNFAPKVMYYETKTIWCSSPAKATIFTSFLAAEHHMHMVDKARAPKGWADGSIEVFDVVPFITELQHSPNAKGIVVKRKKEE